MLRGMGIPHQQEVPSSDGLFSLDILAQVQALDVLGYHGQDQAGRQSLESCVAGCLGSACSGACSAVQLHQLRATIPIASRHCARHSCNCADSGALADSIGAL